MEDEDRHNKCHAAFVFNIRRKSQYLYHAINFALKEKGENLLTWRQICDRAVEHIKKFEDNDDLPESHFPKSSWITGKTIMRWFHQFRYSSETFINYPFRSSQLDKTPPFFDLNPTFKERFLQHARKNLKHLTGEIMYDFVHNQLLKELIDKENEKSVNDEIFSKEDILKKYGLTCLCMQSIYNWMRQFGFKYKPRRKTFYVDGHEKAETVEYRKAYITRYLKNEIRSHRWIQLPVLRVEELEKNTLSSAELMHLNTKIVKMNSHFSNFILTTMIACKMSGENLVFHNLTLEET